MRLAENVVMRDIITVIVKNIVRYISLDENGDIFVILIYYNVHWSLFELKI